MDDIRYGQHLISYVDILGFKELVENQNKVDELYRIVINSQKNIGVKGIMYHTKSEYDFGHFTFSDLFVRAINVTSELEVRNYQNLLRREIIILGLAQSTILESTKTLIRGSITIDDLYFKSSESLIIGPGLIRAHHLESKFAIYPRIIIDPKIILKIGEEFFKNDRIDISDLKKDDDFTGNVVTYGCLKKDVDGIYFVDYLQVALIIDYLDEEYLWLKSLQSHKDLIEEMENKYLNYSNSTSDFSIYQKISWLKNYHNSFIQKKISGITRNEDLHENLKALLIL